MSWAGGRSRKWLGADDALELPDELRVQPQGELRLDALLDGDSPQLLELRRVRSAEVEVGELGVGVAPPQGECLVEQCHGSGGIAGGGGPLPLGDPAAEAGGIELLVVDPEQVARGAGEGWVSGRWRATGSSVDRRRETYVCRAAVASAGWSSAQRMSAKRSTETTWSAWTRSAPSSRRCLALPSRTTRSPSRTSSGPKTMYSTPALSLGLACPCNVTAVT